MPGLEAIVWIDPPLLVERELAGTTHDAVIGGRPTSLTFPIDGPVSLTQLLPGPPPTIPNFPPPPLAQRQAFGSTSLTMSLPVSDAGLLVTALRLRWSDPKFEARVGELGVVSEFGNDVAIWLGIARNWLAVWDGDVRDPEFVQPPPLVRLALVDDLDRGPHYAGGGPTRSIRTQQATLVVSEERICAAFAAASRDWPLPLAHGLLHEARLYHTRHDYRHSVINSCTAAEVGLSNYIRRHLADLGYSTKEVKNTLKGVNGVVDLYRLVAASTNVQVVSIGQVMNQLAKPRNLAAHEGEALDHVSATPAFQTARTLVDRLDPLSTPGEILARAGG